jgi:hypothetical protein
VSKQQKISAILDKGDEMTKQRQVRIPTSVVSETQEKPKQTRVKDTPELATDLLDKYASISEGLGDLSDLADQGSVVADATLRLYASLVDELAQFKSAIKKLRTRVFKEVFEIKVLEFDKKLERTVQQAINKLGEK